MKIALYVTLTVVILIAHAIQVENHNLKEQFAAEHPNCYRE